RRCSPTSRRARRRRCTATSRRRCSMARNRASMREGPLADLFRATEAAQRGERPGEHEGGDDAGAGASEARVEPTPQEREAERPIKRWLEQIPDNPARLERGRQTASDLAVSRVV